jgi:hypothetical protein
MEGILHSCKKRMRKQMIIVIWDQTIQSMAQKSKYYIGQRLRRPVPISLVKYKQAHILFPLPPHIKLDVCVHPPHKCIC